MSFSWKILKLFFLITVFFLLKPTDFIFSADFNCCLSLQSDGSVKKYFSNDALLTSEQCLNVFCKAIDPLTPNKQPTEECVAKNVDSESECKLEEKGCCACETTREDVIETDYEYKEKSLCIGTSCEFISEGQETCEKRVTETKPRPGGCCQMTSIYISGSKEITEVVYGNQNEEECAAFCSNSSSENKKLKCEFLKDVKASECAQKQGTSVEKDMIGGTGGTVNLVNPLGGQDIEGKEKGETNLNQILGRVVASAMGVLGSITLLVFVTGGFMWLTAAGSPERVKKGTETMVWAVIGLFIIFSSYAILTLVFQAIGAQN